MARVCTSSLSSTTTMSTPAPKRVCIVGAGASGMSAAYALSRHPERYQVTVFDKQDVAGGMATSIDIDADKYGAAYINDGVQGCSPVFANTLRIFRMLGFEATEVGMQISFGKDKDFWTNVYPTSLVAQFQGDIKKFGTALSIIKKFEPVFAMIPVHTMLKMFGFSKDFGDKMVYPWSRSSSGRATKRRIFHLRSSNGCSKILACASSNTQRRVCWQYPDYAGVPQAARCLPSLEGEAASRGNVTFRLGHEVVEVMSRHEKGGAAASGPVHIKLKTSIDGQESFEEEFFDELILAIDADSCLKLLGKQSTWMERKVLGNVKYLYDVTITHNDWIICGSSAQERQETEESFKFARDNFRPLYYTMQYPQDKAKIEMSFDLTHYQPQFRGEKPAGPIDPEDRSNHRNECERAEVTREAQDSSKGEAGAEARTGKDADERPEPPLEQHVFQTIFLDRDGSQDLWTWKDINPEKKIYEKWWKQQSHRWQHYAGTVPWMMWINGKNHTHFAGAWSVLNMHELAVTSGFAAAYRLGAEYPFHGDEDCERLFRMYLAAATVYA
ncbi:FAD/NAD-P-binding domain-containing protein [Fomitopsis serialis]|uniref:FAD/NAD-P-binding domain-containing protein n=1 Tax=Fomitopsis serialis TaxID=139415 RepID=UPI00200780DF|nr:FAD/NAD-P-binding domain-containing protein [Neoantrodia serialis]KAH9935339.1 FAD/NAD-P-binding domain-containing protein [Neoantrodia serialis]